MKKLLSIVIANYNYGRYIESAIRSVIDQNDDRVELIVCDAASTDESVEIIRSYSDKIAWWCSEKDKGQSDAFNKGFMHSTGKFLTWLNADDVFIPGAVEAILKEILLHDECEWFTGNFYRFTPDGKVMEIGWGPHFYPNWLQRKSSPVVAFGPSTIFARSLFDRKGGFDVNCHFSMDTEMWIRYITSGIKQRRINHFIWGFRMHEDSKTAEFGDHKLDSIRADKFAAEKRRYIEKYNYKDSRLVHYVLLLWRIIDGSLLKRLFLQMTFRRASV